jgi:threonine/homoserine/homoserine lactone efflux protein
VLRRGFWTNALNPKVALFFLAFVPQFIPHDAPHPSLTFLALGLLFNFNGLWVNFGWALAAAWMARRVGAVQSGMRALERAAGAIFIGFGVKLALADNPSH